MNAATLSRTRRQIAQAAKEALTPLAQAYAKLASARRVLAAQDGATLETSFAIAKHAQFQLAELQTRLAGAIGAIVARYGLQAYMDDPQEPVAQDEAYRKIALR